MGSRGDQHSDMGLHNRSESVMNSASSAMSTNLFFASAWDPIVSLSRHGTFGGSSVVSQGEFTNSPYPVVMETQGICSTSHLGHYQSDSSFVEPMPRFPCFGNGGFSGMAGSFGLGECGHIANSECHPNYMLTKDCNNERSLANAVQSQEDHQVVEDEDAAVGASPNGKRRKRVAESNSPFDRNKDAEGELLRDPSGDSSDVPREQDEKRPKTEQNLGANLRGKQAAKQTKDNGEAPKENYVHVRARRGQATNSHSLAERVRREKISERMRLLQELVPGCSKITGKAVMLDEIINYVQSLQHQVEFLSMKLATVNPELNIDIERILSKEILHSRGGNASVLGFNPGMNSHPYSHGIFQGSMPVIPNTSSQFSPVPQTALDNELQSLFHMGFDTSSALNSFGPNGRLKPEL